MITTPNTVKYYAPSFTLQAVCCIFFICISGEINFVSTCQVDEEFSALNYKSSIDGLFTFNVLNRNVLDMKHVEAIRIEFSGSHIPHPGIKHQYWPYH